MTHKRCASRSIIWSAYGIETAEIIVAAAGDTKATEDAVAARSYFMAFPFVALGSYERRCGRSCRGVFFLLHADSFPPLNALGRSSASCEITRFWEEPSSTALQNRWSLRLISWLNRRRYF